MLKLISRWLSPVCWKLVFRQGLGFCARDDWRTTVIAVGFGVFQQFKVDDGGSNGLQLAMMVPEDELLADAYAVP